MPINVDFYLVESFSMVESRPFICRLVEKIYKKQHKIFIYVASMDDAEHLNTALWTFRDVSFVPHVIYETDPKADAPIQIGYTNPPADADDILINLTAEVPAFFNNFKRVLEIVPSDPELKKISRIKYKQYQQNDCELVMHNITK